jgi:hypothetical protein
MGRLVILAKVQDPRFITVRRGGTLQDDDHLGRPGAALATTCAHRSQASFYADTI